MISAEFLTARSFAFEWLTQNGRLIAIDAPTVAVAELLAKQLTELEEQGVLVYETAQ